MLSGGFADAPVSRSLVFGLIASSILVSLLDIKHYFWIQIDPHFWEYGQLWRAFIYQLCYTNSGETLFACMTLYHLRCIERMWGSRKFASFLVVMYLLTSVIPPLLLALVLRPLSFNNLNYLPAGPTPLLFALLSQFHAVIPHIYKYRLATTSSTEPGAPHSGLTFSDKSYTYAIAGQLSLVQFPGSLFGAVLGWMLGYMWRNEILPARLTRFRVPAWVVGAKPMKREEYDSLRRRLESENASGTATGSDTRPGGVEQRRSMGRQLFDQFRGQ